MNPVILSQQSAFDNQSSVVLGDVMKRLGNLEEQVNEILPAIGRVAESVTNLASSMAEVKSDVKDLGTSIVEYKVEAANFEQRISDLEKTNESRKKESLDRNGRILGVVGGAVASLVVAALVYFLKLR